MRMKLPFIRPGTLILSLIIFFGYSAAITFAAPASELIPRWQEHDPTATQTVNHDAFDQFLLSYRKEGPDGVARIAYAQVSREDHKALKAYIGSLQKTEVSRLSRPEQFAFWVNLYNAATVDLILDHKPENGIKEINISPGFFSIGPWDKEFLRVEGQDLSLNTIEHNILRPVWKDPRTHYVINCASIGCPDIPVKAVRAEGLERLLDEAVKIYINHPRGVRVNNDNSVTLSSIYDWFSKDFGENDEAILDHIRLYADEPLKQKLGPVREIDGYRYDWSLNRASKAEG